MKHLFVNFMSDPIVERGTVLGGQFNWGRFSKA